MILAQVLVRTFAVQNTEVRFGSEATHAPQQGMSALPPESGHVQHNNRCPLLAKSRHLRRRHFSNGPAIFIRMPIVGTFHASERANGKFAIYSIAKTMRPQK